MVIPSLADEVGWHHTCRDDGQDSDGARRQAPKRSLRPTGGCRMSLRDLVDGSLSRQTPRGRQPVQWGQTRPRRPTRTLPAPTNAVVDPNNAHPILAAGRRGSAAAECRGRSIHCFVAQRVAKAEPLAETEGSATQAATWAARPADSGAKPAQSTSYDCLAGSEEPVVGGGWPGEAGVDLGEGGLVDEPDRAGAGGEGEQVACAAVDLPGGVGVALHRGRDGVA
jgi:hypothetical protein